MKKKILVLLAFITFLFLAIYANASDFSVTFKPNGMNANQMGFYVRIHNNSGATVDLSDLKLFYFYTSEITGESYVDTTSSYDDLNLEVILHKNLYPLPNATDIIELNFASGTGTINNGSSSDEIEITILGELGDGLYFDRSNDYSHNPNVGVYDSPIENENIILTNQDEVVWGTKTLCLHKQYAIVSGGWYDHTIMATQQAQNNARVRNEDNDILEMTNAAIPRKVVFDFKDISANTNFSMIDKITCKILHYEDDLFDDDDIRITVGKGLKPDEVPTIWDTTLMPANKGVTNEGYYNWDIDITNIKSAADFNDLQLKIAFVNGTNGTLRINKICLEIYYKWDGHTPENAVQLTADSVKYIDLSFGYVYVSMPVSAGSLNIASDYGFVIMAEGLGFPNNTLPENTFFGPFYMAYYSVLNSLVKINKFDGDVYLKLKYSY